MSAKNVSLTMLKLPCFEWDPIRNTEPDKCGWVDNCWKRIEYVKIIPAWRIVSIWVHPPVEYKLNENTTVRAETDVCMHVDGMGAVFIDLSLPDLLKKLKSAGIDTKDLTK